MTFQEHLTVNDYTVGIICALHNELRAVRSLVDEVHPDPQLSSRDTNFYTLGRIGAHNVVMSCLPAGEYGTSSAASVATQMYMSFPMVQFALLVGIAGGVPGEADVRLGDVVVSVPTGMQPGVIQYDLGIVMEDGSFKETGYLQKPPSVLLAAVERLRSDSNVPQNPLQIYLDALARRDSRYECPGKNCDILFKANYTSDMSGALSGNYQDFQFQRAARNFEHPYIHYGLIASGNRVMKNGLERDRLGKRHNILCFEMEAAGVVNVIPCLVIRGICDYSDSHKNKGWQEYASATAAAYAKLLLSRVQPYQPHRASAAGQYGET